MVVVNCGHFWAGGRFRLGISGHGGTGWGVDSGVQIRVFGQGGFWDFWAGDY